MTPSLRLAEIVAEVLEESAFVFVEGGAAGSLGEDSVTASLHVGGGAPCRLELATSESLAREIAANLLGLDSPEEVSPGQALDALGETLNVVAGSFVATVLGDGAEPWLGTPAVRRGASPIPPSLVAEGGQPVGCAFTSLSQEQP